MSLSNTIPWRRQKYLYYWRIRILNKDTGFVPATAARAEILTELYSQTFFRREKENSRHNKIVIIWRTLCWQRANRLNWNECCIVFNTDCDSKTHNALHHMIHSLNEINCKECCIVFDTVCEIKTPYWSASPLSRWGTVSTHRGNFINWINIFL